MPLSAWGDEFEANYTAVARGLRDLVRPWRGTRLYLTLPFPLRHGQLDRSVEGSGFMERVRRVGARLGVPLIDLAPPFVEAVVRGHNATHSAAVPSRAPRDQAPNQAASEVLYRDEMHPSRVGSQVVWRAILRSLREARVRAA